MYCSNSHHRPRATNAHLKNPTPRNHASKLQKHEHEHSPAQKTIGANLKNKNKLTPKSERTQQKILQRYFEDMARDTGKISYGIADTIRALELSAVDTIVVAKDSKLETRGTSIVLADGKKTIESKYLFAGNKEEKVRFVDWLVENHRTFGAELVLISDSAENGIKFVQGMGGVGAFLRWTVNFEQLNELEEEFEDKDLEKRMTEWDLEESRFLERIRRSHL